MPVRSSGLALTGDAMPFKLSSFVFWSGIYNAALACFLLFPPLYRAVGLNVCSPVWAWLIAGIPGLYGRRTDLSLSRSFAGRNARLLGGAVTLHRRAHSRPGGPPQ